MVANCTFGGIGAGLLQEEQRQRVIGIAEAGDADRLAFEVFDRADLRRLFRRDGEGEERQLAGRGNALHRGAMRIGLQRDIERGRGVIDRAADQRLHRRRAAAHVDELDIEPFLLEMPVMRRDDVGDDTEKLASRRRA